MKRIRLVVFSPFLMLLVLLAGCSQPTSTPAPTATPTPTPPPPSDYFLDAVTAAVGPMLLGTLQSPVYDTYDVGGSMERVLGFSGISSGHVERRGVNGLDVETLGVYILMQTGDVLEVPVVTRIGQDSFVITPTQQVISTTAITDDLQPISTTVTWHSPFERGAAVMLVTGNSAFVQPNGLDWTACTGDLYAFGVTVGDDFCALGRYMDDTYPDALYLLTLRVLQDVPEGWALTGFVLPVVWDVPPVQLPEVSQ